MKSIEMHGEMLKALNMFVSEFDSSIRLDVFTFLLSEERKEQLAQPSSHAGSPSEPSRVCRAQSPQELLRKCDVSSSTDKALILAYWMEENEKKENFSSLDLKNAFSSAREPAPSNPSDVLAKLDGANRVMKAEKIGKSQTYRLTQTGIEQVQTWLTTPRQN